MSIDEKKKIQWFTPKGNGNSQGNALDGVDLEGRSDLGDGPIKKLGQYLSNLTQKNYYSIGNPAGLPETYYTEPDLGTNPPTPSGQGADAFIEHATADAKAYFDTISVGQSPGPGGGGALGPASGLVAQKNSQTAGNNTLTQIKGDDWSTTTSQNDSTAGTSGHEFAVRNLIQNTVLKYNRWNPVKGDSPYIDDGDYSHGIYTNQDDLGRYDPLASKQVKLDALRRVAINMLIRSAGGKGNSESSSGDMITDVGAIPVSLGFQQVDFLETRPIAQIDNDKALKNLSEPTKEYGNSDWLTKDYGESKNNKSWGQLNNPLVPFGGPLPLGMIAIAAIASLALLVAGAVIGIVFDILAAIGFGVDSLAAYAMGNSKGDREFGDFDGPSQIIKVLLGLPALEATASYTKAMIFGISTFFQGLSDGVSSGYYTVVSRNAIRDVRQIEEAGKAMGSLGGDPVGAIAGIFLLIEALTTSATYKFMLTMIKLGDIDCASGSKWFKDGPYPLEPSEEAKVAAQAPLLNNLHKKSKLTPVKNSPMAWSGWVLPSAILLPSQMRTAMGGVGSSILNRQVKAYPGQEDATGMPLEFDAESTMRYPKLRALPKGENRLTSAEVKWIEAQLDSTYMPFYFHDLRTNEIIAFHAFVDSITDEWQPSWNSVGGFGRMDEVQIYKNTKRSLGCTFTIAATSEEDFSEMYVKINKLVSMIYPQWSAGMVRKMAEPPAGQPDRFIQPFSQIPTASPVIRWRLGDIIKSNYTPKGIRKLFGDGDEDLFGFPDLDAADKTKMYNDISTEMEALVADQFQTNQFGTRAKSLTVTDAVAANAKIAMGLPAGVSAPQPGYVYSLIGLRTYPRVIEKGPGIFTIMKQAAQGGKKNWGLQAEGFLCIGYYFPIKITIGGSAPSLRKSKSATETAVMFVMKPLEKGVKSGLITPMKDENGDDILIAVTSLRVGGFHLDATRKVIAGQLAGVKDPLSVTHVSDIMGDIEFESAYFAPENNAVIRSFESAGGQGMAGVITQLSMDWNEATWEIDPVHGRAPKWCKVTMGFSPIHDIPLGLDFEGGMRAPAYNVGKANAALFGAGPYEKINVDEMQDLQAILKWQKDVEKRAEDKTFGEKLKMKLPKLGKE